MILNELADLHRQRIPGYDLTCQYQAGIPTHKARLKVDVLKKQEVPAPAQFALKLIDLGISTETEIANALGMEIEFVRDALAYLDLHQLIIRRFGSPENPSITFATTGKGKQALREAMTALYVKRFYIQVDGLTGEIAPLDESVLQTGQDLNKMGIWLLHASPGKRPIAESLNNKLSALESVFKESEGFDSSDQLVEVLDVERPWLMYKVVNVLVFRDRTTGRVDLRVFEGYEPVPEYDRILKKREQSGGRVIPDDLLDSAVDYVLPSELVQELRPKIERLEELDRQVQEAASEKDELQASLEKLDEETSAEAVTSKTARIQELESEVQRLKAAQGQSRIVQDNEHRQLLKNALSLAQRGVVIISPWIRRSATDEEIIKLIEQAVQRGVWIAIGYGMPLRRHESKDLYIDEWVAKQFRRIQKRPDGKRLQVKWLGNTHEKILVCDRQFCVVTSHNWLSYRGDKGFRRETGTYSEDPKIVERVATDVLKRFEPLPDGFSLLEPPGPRTLADMLTGENAALEYKSSMRWDLRTQQVNKALEKVIAKTVAGFLNSKGGTLLIGVADDCTVLGIEHDLQTIGRMDRDGYEQKLHQVLTDTLGAEFSQYQHVSFEESEGKTVCIVRVEPSPKPVYLTDKGIKEFYVRVGNTTRPLDMQAAHDYISMHWPA